jgi:hypothetical protein
MFRKFLLRKIILLKLSLGLLKIDSDYSNENDQQLKSTIKTLKKVLEDIDSKKEKSKYLNSNSEKDLDQIIKSIKSQQEYMKISMNEVNKVEISYNNFVLNQLTFVLSLIGIGTLVHSFYPSLNPEYKILTIIVSGFILYFINLWSRADFQFIIEGHLNDYNYAKDIENLQNKILESYLKYKK